MSTISIDVLSILTTFSTALGGPSNERDMILILHCRESLRSVLSAAGTEDAGQAWLLWRALTTEKTLYLDLHMARHWAT